MTIPTNGKANTCEQFRTMSSLTDASKILPKTIGRRTERTMEDYLMNDQYGLRKQEGL